MIRGLTLCFLCGTVSAASGCDNVENAPVIEVSLGQSFADAFPKELRHELEISDRSFAMKRFFVERPHTLVITINQEKIVIPAHKERLAPFFRPTVIRGKFIGAISAWLTEEDISRIDAKRIAARHCSRLEKAIGAKTSVDPDATISSNMNRYRTTVELLDEWVPVCTVDNTKRAGQLILSGPLDPSDGVSVPDFSEKNYMLRLSLIKYSSPL